MAEPKILSKNYVSSDCVITVSHADAVKSYLHDRDNASKWLSSGANDDATLISIEVEFKEGTTAVDRTIDRLLLINHNLKNWDFYSWDDGAEDWVLEASENTDAASTTFKSFDPVTTSKVKLECDATQIADAEKFIGEMIVAEEQVELDELVSLDRKDRERTRSMEMGEGSEHRMISRWTPYRSTKYAARAVVQLLNRTGQDWEADRLLIKEICETRIPFLWYPESAQRPDEIFLVWWRGAWAERYVSTYKGAGIEVPMELSEV